MRHNIDRQTENVMLERVSFDTGDYIARARALRPLITAHAARIEQEREIAPEVLSALHDAQLFRMLVPKSCDGAEVAPATFMQAIEELAKADGSTAWCVAQASGCSMAAAYLEPKVAREIFGDARSVMAWGPVGPDAKAVAVESGYRASGSWSFASGIKHAGWLGCHCPVVEADGTPRLGPDGKPAERTMLIPKASAKIKDIWRVVGLKGTGSDNYTIDDLFVPDAYTFTREFAADRREQVRSIASPPFTSMAPALPRLDSGWRAARLTTSSHWLRPKSPRPRPSCCATTR
jgi:alkylation response protein AidB-like acyl-CoA dehydrogenase